ncbi:MAG TPA: FkbM family methyltransferase [Bryobacteraceae bacterium]|jgi:FkbM family methyltransferase|nr:FkbM family methyltransferase [Bryobacteraceae bacterium]
MVSDLIIDAGMHTGHDTAFYLAKGFRVAAIEANPSLVAAATEKFRGPIATGQLRIFPEAIASHNGTIDFWINQGHDDWGTTEFSFAERNQKFGFPSVKVTVPARSFNEILDEVGTPYYLKIDIEGADLLCLEALRGREKPKYVSIEGDLNGFNEAFTELALLWTLGYRNFKVVNQGMNHTVRCPQPPLEGRYVDATFDRGTCSGPFGEEAPGRWMEADATMRKIRRLLRDQRDYGMAGKHFKTAWGNIYRKWRRLMREPVAWWDVHARQ